MFSKPREIVLMLYPVITVSTAEVKSLEKVVMKNSHTTRGFFLNLLMDLGIEARELEMAQ
jgi:hypothetical protein